MASAAEQPTYDPTPRRLAEARRQGDVAQSRDLRGALALAATGAVLVACGPSMTGQLRAYFAESLARAARGDGYGEAVRGFYNAVRILALPLAVALVVSLLVGLIQTGGLWTGPPRADFGRLLPAVGRGRGPHARLGEMVRGSGKLAILLAVAAATLAPLLPRLASLAGASPSQALAAFGAMAQRLGLRMVIAAVLLGAADEVWVRARHRLRLRMTRREIDRERRELEGEPLHRQARQHERRRREGDVVARAVTDLRGADLVVTTGGYMAAHEAIAVALRYEPGGQRAPVVVAVGRRLLAVSLIDAARAAGVPVFDEDGLAAALADLVAGAEIPETSYEPVAELLRRIDVGRAGIDRETLVSRT